jgi:hypothetical protein
MSIIHVNQIASNIRDRFEPIVDMSDVKTTDPGQREAQFLSRSLAAFVIAALAKIEDPEAAKAVVDEYQDDGIDGFFFSQTEHICYLVQSKWSKDGSGSIDLASTLKFIQGVGTFSRRQNRGSRTKDAEPKNRD